MNTADTIGALANTATVIVKFNNILRDDKDGIFTVYDGFRFETPDAEMITEGSTYQTSWFAFQISAPPEGREIAVIAIGIETACYTQARKVVYPGNNVIYLIAEEEFLYNYHGV